MESSFYTRLSNYAESEKIITALKEYGLYEDLERIVSKIEESLREQDYDKLVTTASSILVTVNSKIGKIVDSDKKMLEYVISDIFSSFIKILPNDVHEKVCKALNDTCDFHFYDFEALIGYIGTYRPVPKPKLEAKQKKVYELLNMPSDAKLYYEWLGDPKDISDFIQNLKDQKYINTVKGFSKIFDKKKEPNFTISFNPMFRDEIIVLFDKAKEMNLIKPRGTSGHFAPFVAYAVDNENKKFIEKAINKEHNRIKKNTEKYAEIVKKVEKILKIYIKNKHK